jgi:hypothetical protein
LDGDGVGGGFFGDLCGSPGGVICATVVGAGGAFTLGGV